MSLHISAEYISGDEYVDESEREDAASALTNPPRLLWLHLAGREQRLTVMIQHQIHVVRLYSSHSPALRGIVLCHHETTLLFKANKHEYLN